ncbi:uncharacterized protein [Parasteatoda tepidariorum]|uniref:uncharacterized protein n=1 Tax=Parasteatoda tepidariorum TaxID=114398 RepID=UPI00077FC5AE|nr:uncharacterized protein LOC107447274 [Parasteatoda tepidariorum]
MLGEEDVPSLEVSEEGGLFWKFCSWIIRGRRTTSSSHEDSPRKDISHNTKTVLPLCKELKVVDIELSNKNFKSVIESSLEKTKIRFICPDDSDKYYPSDYFLAKIASRVYNEQSSDDCLEKGWVLLTTADSSDGYVGAAYWNAKNLQVVVAHKGTQNVKDIWADYQGIFSKKYTSQMSSAATFSSIVIETLKELNKKYSTDLNLSCAGHSLGGWLAQVTAFSTQYLTKAIEGEEEFFAIRKNENEGYHTHTVAFDSPGCKDMLLKMESDFDVRHSGRANLSSFLDVTIFLSAPNLVNTRNSHLNVGNLYRVFIDDLPARRTGWDLFRYTTETHKMDKIMNGLSSMENSCSSGKIMKVIDWPLAKEGTSGFLSENIFTDKNEYEHFHKLAERTGSYNPTPDGTEYCTLRYQVKEVEKDECSANVFKQSEFDFLEGYQVLKRISMLSIVRDLMFPPESETAEKTKEKTGEKTEEKRKSKITNEKVEEILKYFEIKAGEGRGVIKCNSENELQKLIIYVKIILFIFPNIHYEIKDKLKNLDVYNNVYEKQSLDYLDTIKSVEIRNSSMESIISFLRNSKLQFLRFICKVHPAIGIQKIRGILKKAKEDYRYSKVFFLSLDQLVNLEQFFPLQNFLIHLDKKLSVLFVVGCNTDSKKAVNLFKNLFITLKSRPKFKLILVSHEYNSLEDCFGNKRNLCSEIKDDSSITFQDLTDVSQEQLLEKKVCFQGKEVDLDTLITEETKQLIDVQTLSKLINNDTIEIGKPVPDLGDVKNYYIDQTFTRHVKVKSDIKENKSKFVFTNSNTCDTSKFNQGEDIILISDREDYFDELSKKNENRNVHWLKEEDDQFVWQKSYGTLSNLREFIDTENASECNDVDGSVVIISSVSGAGKTTVLTELAQRLKKNDPSLWVMRFNLNSYTEKLVGEEFVNDTANVFEFLLDIASLNSPLEKDLFKHRLNSEGGKVALLFDGFDEIVPKYKEKVIELLKVLKNLKIEKLYVTTRPHMKNELEDALNILAYTLKLMSKEDQIIFLRKYWSKELELNITEERIFKIFAKQLLDCMSRPISDERKEFTGLPLQTKMLAEVFGKDFKNFYKSPLQNMTSLIKKLNLLELYNVFVDSKYKRHLADKKNFDLTKSGTEYKILYNSFIENHSLLALNSFFGESDLNKFLSEEFKQLKEYTKQVLEGEENSEFITCNVDGKTSFIHPSFAEFFVACFYWKNIEKQEVKNFLCEHIFSEDTELVRIFFDYMAIDNQDECKVHIAVLNNDIIQIELLFSGAEESGDLINATDSLGRTALHLAAPYGHLTTASSLLNHGYNVNAQDQLLCGGPLRYADKCGHWFVAEMLLEKEANSIDMPNSKEIIQNCIAGERRITLLHNASMAGLVNFLKVLIENKPNFVNAMDEFGFTPLYHALNKDVAELLITRGANINCKNDRGWTPLHASVAKKNKEFVDFLIKRGTNIDVKDNDGFTPLHVATILDDNELADVLITRHADIEAKDDSGETPLHSACFEDNNEVMKLLIKHGANIEAKNFGGLTPLHIAAATDNSRIVMFFINRGANVEAMDNGCRTPLHIAAAGDSTSVVEVLITNGANIESKECCYRTPLHIAAVKDSASAARVLIIKGACVNAKDIDCRTPLHVAAEENSARVAEILLMNGAEIEAKDAWGWTPLPLAFERSSVDVAKFLMEKGADRLSRDNSGYSIPQKDIELRDDVDSQDDDDQNNPSFCQSFCAKAKYLILIY